MRSLLVALLLSAAAGAVDAQLISPGKLSSAHAELEGIRSCTNCHDLGRKGASSAKCLECHGPVATRVARNSGYHASVRAQECTSCHKEHFGREFQLVRLDSGSFDHRSTGHALEPAHTGVECRTCHSPSNIRAPDVRAWTAKHDVESKTYMGLDDTCTSCHSGDDPHRGQFRNGCDACHSATTWKKADSFDHARTRFRLTGEHRSVGCDGCHRSVVASGASFVKFAGTASGECSTCHEEPHEGRMGRGCATCHDTGGWDRVNGTAVAGRFDHSRTAFPLNGRHTDTSCTSCHAPTRGRADLHIRFAGSRSGSYPKPVATGCAACHADRHAGEFSNAAIGTACEGCHTENAFSPATFDIERHNRSTTFALTGSHVSTPCTSCHGVEPGGPHFRLAASSCAGCHAEKSPHGDRFGGRGCAECHATSTFRVTDFDHAGVTAGTCATCHSDEQPHGDQFGATACDACHATTSFRIERFDHSRTRFVLDGAHARASCASCHEPVGSQGRTIVIYRPVATECSACHGGTA
jgi:predicted CXXCH cytochrome family protein